MRRFSGLWWASILLSSVVTGGGSLLMLSLLTDWPLLTAIKASIAAALFGDIVLALFMEKFSPTHVKVGPGDRTHDADLPTDIGRTLEDFAEGRGRVAIRGETWHARQEPGSPDRLAAGAAVRVLGREGLTLVVMAANIR